MPQAALREAADRLKVDQAVLKAIDDWSFENLPELGEPLYITLRRYSRILGLGPAKYESQLPQEHQQAATEFTKRKGIFFVSRAGYLAALGLIVAVFMGFIGWRTIRANAIPELVIYSPDAGAVLDLSQAQITGRTSEGAQVFINGNSVPVETNGEFTGKVILAPGPNTVEIRAINSFARENVQERVIVRR